MGKWGTKEDPKAESHADGAEGVKRVPDLTLWCWGSNLGPHTCKANALPRTYIPDYEEYLNG